MDKLLYNQNRLKINQWLLNIKKLTLQYKLFDYLYGIKLFITT